MNSQIQENETLTAYETIRFHERWKLVVNRISKHLNNSLIYQHPMETTLEQLLTAMG